MLLQLHLIFLWILQLQLCYHSTLCNKFNWKGVVKQTKNLWVFFLLGWIYVSQKHVPTHLSTAYKNIVELMGHAVYRMEYGQFVCGEPQTTCPLPLAIKWNWLILPVGGIVESSSSTDLSSAAQFAKDRFAQPMQLRSPRFQSRYADEVIHFNRLSSNKFNPDLIYVKRIS